MTFSELIGLIIGIVSLSGFLDSWSHESTRSRLSDLLSPQSYKSLQKIRIRIISTLCSFYELFFYKKNRKSNILIWRSIVGFWFGSVVSGTVFSIIGYSALSEFKSINYIIGTLFCLVYAFENNIDRFSPKKIPELFSNILFYISALFILFIFIPTESKSNIFSFLLSLTFPLSRKVMVFAAAMIDAINDVFSGKPPDYRSNGRLSRLFTENMVISIYKVSLATVLFIFIISFFIDKSILINEIINQSNAVSIIYLVLIIVVNSLILTKNVGIVCGLRESATNRRLNTLSITLFIIFDLIGTAIITGSILIPDVGFSKIMDAVLLKEFYILPGIVFWSGVLCSMFVYIFLLIVFITNLINRLLSGFSFFDKYFKIYEKPFSSFGILVSFLLILYYIYTKVI